IANIKLYDRDNIPGGTLKSFQLKKASAAKVAQTINLFWSSRYGIQEGSLGHQIRVTFDDSSNTVFVQAAPADMLDIEELIKNFDTLTPKSETELRIVGLQNAPAEDLANIILKAISDGQVIPTNPATVLPSTTGAAPVVPITPIAPITPGTTTTPRTGGPGGTL